MTQLRSRLLECLASCVMGPCRWRKGHFPRATPQHSFVPHLRARPSLPKPRLFDAGCSRIGTTRAWRLRDLLLFRRRCGPPRIQENVSSHSSEESEFTEDGEASLSKGQDEMNSQARVWRPGEQEWLYSWSLVSGESSEVAVDLT